MRLIIDNREHDLIPICQKIVEADPMNIVIEIAQLPLGDIVLQSEEGQDILIIERKSLQDLLASIKDGRYEEQSHRLKNASGLASHNVLYMIEGMYSTLRTPADKKLILSAMASLNYFKGFSTFRTCSLYETAETVLYMANKIEKNIQKGGDKATEETAYSGLVKKVKKENITPENMGEIMLCQIPGISSLYARAILAHFDGFSNLVEKVKDGSADFANITYDQKGKPRKIPKTCGEEILRLLG